jgi:hypothetical protein
MRPGVLFVGALAVFALLGLLAGRAPDPPEPRQPKPATQPSVTDEPGDPRQLAERWGRSFAVWNHSSLGRQLRLLAGTAAPPLAAELRRGAAAVQRDESLTRDGAGSRGSVEVVRLSGSGSERRVLVVTRETPYSAAGTDLQGARYRVYTGTVEREARGRWRMRSWNRQP